MVMSGKQLIVDNYQFGYQNQEIFDELWSGAISFKYRIEDVRLGKFFSVDPLYKKYPGLSSYSFSENRVIDSGELEGLERYYAANGEFLGQIGKNRQMRVVRMETVDEWSIASMKMKIEKLAQLPDVKAVAQLENQSSMVYKSMDAAAVAFSRGNNHDPETGKNGEERAAGIYEFRLDVIGLKPLRKFYVLGNVATGKMDADGFGESVSPDDSKFVGLTRVAVAHTHGRDDRYIDDEHFSDNEKYSDDCINCWQEMMDKNFARKEQIPLYLATPFGKLWVFKPNGEMNSGSKGAATTTLIDLVPPQKESFYEDSFYEPVKE